MELDRFEETNHEVSTSPRTTIGTAVLVAAGKGSLGDVIAGCIEKLEIGCRISVVE